jgi:fimbrial chaperone protein
MKGDLMRHLYPALLAAPLALAALLPAPAFAQSGPILIWPVNPTIQPDARSTALWLENPGKAPIQLQVRVFAWQQSGEGDAYAAQTDVIGTPPMVTIAPGSKQLVRLTRTQPAPARSEQAFRVIVDEIPLPGATSSADSAARIQFRMRYAIPLFSYGAGYAEPDRKASPSAQSLAWRIVGEGHARFLEIRNTGATHARLVDAAFDADAKPFAPGLLGYVLAGSTMRWALPDGAGAGALRISVNGTATTLPVSDG